MLTTVKYSWQNKTMNFIVTIGHTLFQCECSCITFNLKLNLQRVYRLKRVSYKSTGL